MRRRALYYRCNSPDCRGVNVPKDRLEGDFKAVLASVTTTAMPQLKTFRARVKKLWSERHAEAIRDRQR